MSTDIFIKNLAYELLNAVNRNYEDNYDPYRFGKFVEEKPPFSLKQWIIGRLNKKGYYNRMENFKMAQQIKYSDFPLGDFSYLEDILEDKESKELLIRIIAYRMLGYKKVKLPLNTPEFWSNQHLIEAHQSKQDVYPINFMDFKLPLTDLAFLALPIRMYNSALGVNILFIIKQYELHRENIHIEAEEGDIVIDGGGCYGDTALYFANKVGPSGKVHVFEFIPDNIALFNRNVEMNPALVPRIELVKHPLWEVSGKDVFYISNGPGSKVSLDHLEGFTGKTATLTIDDHVKQAGIKKVDLIKMDIEGAELNALKGATQTIIGFRPKLAIALYHSTKDFDVIPRFLNELGLGYRFYLSHATIYGEETMLFASIEK